MPLQVAPNSLQTTPEREFNDFYMKKTKKRHWYPNGDTN